MPEESRAEIKKVITELTEKLKALREEIKLSADIRERSDMLKEKIEKIDKEQEQRKEVREMTQGGDAAEQIVRLSLEGMEVAVKVSGESAKNIALILMTVLREEHKTRERRDFPP